MRILQERSMDVTQLRTFSGHPVRIRLEDASELVGTLRTDLLTDRSIAVFLARDGDEGATLYIDDIVEIRVES
jgi:hypothetical protein